MTIFVASCASFAGMLVCGFISAADWEVTVNGRKRDDYVRSVRLSFVFGACAFAFGWGVSASAIFQAAFS